MKSIALYSPKGGVGKSTLAVNLAWCAAALSSRRTLLWELDGQGGASYLLNGKPDARKRAQGIFDRSVPPAALIAHTAYEGLDLLPADESVHALDGLLYTLDRRKRLAKLLAGLADRYDRVVLDCPPVWNEVSEQVFRAADVLIVPLSPSPLAWRALNEVRVYLAKSFKGHPPILPVFSMVDRRRKLHREALEAQPDWPVVPLSSAIEQMAVRQAPLGGFDRRSASAQALAALWAGIERKLTQG